MTNSPPDFEVIINIMLKHKVKYIIVGGVSAVLQGAPMTTFDMDIVPDQSEENILALENALNELSATYRERSELSPTHEHLAGGGHLLLNTMAGALDVLAFIGDGRTYADLCQHTLSIKLDDGEVQILDLQTIILSKEECGRDKDLAMLPLLRSTLQVSKRDKQE